ncbi:TetR/AcrR family transcriptional regulator [Streptomyces sp. SL13]|uniref:TetR/AcrR family transcriptional regulator n=1 Tax=Streptantibioticus silvisoli TaxID=2705255 RepID=A0AA90GWD3_9ACTN|nr:TetR/AcrR family transcriptional regulator [Streptantibioticus silvisoli]MDI5964438.1 TetR/AcrR family transcriptional regulator [Streptantibioticus silvisoli]MDI5969084.1 TetR/AcrR family transcriptional regulator [Streptantibioticus silvisoli]
MTGHRTPATRADAVLNRERILGVAYAAFAEDPRVSLNAVARLAGVGAGTLYRHFPTREDLILAVYRQEVQSLVAAVPGMLDEHPPLEALRGWFLRLADFVRVKHGLGDALRTAAAQQAVGETYEPVTGAVGVLLRACQDAGDVRPGLEPADVLLLMGFLWSTAPGDTGDRQARRVLDLAVRGLR